ncbi:MAG: D-glycero-beta-D-manno-heptose-7-phosphate kinase [Spirochaetota bacterium]
MKIRYDIYKQSLNRLADVKIAVIGDIILDQYLVGDVNRISPEAPVPVVHVRKESLTLGGSGNVVKNLHAIGVKTAVFARVGKDDNAKLLREHLYTEGSSPEELFLLTSEQVPTTIKTRIIAGNQQVCRVDRESVVPLEAGELATVQKQFQEALPQIQGVILSDYDKGYLTPELIQEIIKVSNENGIFVAVDPQVSHFFHYGGAGILTPNHHEAGKALVSNIRSDDEIMAGAKELASRLSTSYMLITRGELGMTLFDNEKDVFSHIPTVAREVFDVTGAGDTVISLFTAFYLAGLSPLESCLVANTGAGLVVEKLGSSVVKQEELTEQIEAMGLF